MEFLSRGVPNSGVPDKGEDPVLLFSPIVFKGRNEIIGDIGVKFWVGIEAIF